MIQSFSTPTLLARDVDKTIEFYTNILGFEIRTDAPFGDGHRWVTLAVPGQSDMEITVCRAQDDEPSVGRQAGSYPWITLLSDNFYEDYERLKNAGVHFPEEPHTEMWGTGVVLKDLDGNNVYLLEHADMSGHEAPQQEQK